MGLFQQISSEGSKRRLQFLVIGGLAVIHHGYSRDTADLDLLRFSGFFARDLRFCLSGMQTNLALAKLPPPGCLVLTNSIGEMQREGAVTHYPFASMLLPAESKIVLREAETIARLTLTQTACAIERFRLTHDRLPEALSELVPDYLASVPTDSFDGQTLRYRRLDKGYTLYSIGQDGRDDGGREPPPRSKGTDTNSYDLTFIVER